MLQEWWRILLEIFEPTFLKLFYRICCLHLTNGHHDFQAFSCYMPTSWEHDDAVEHVYGLLWVLLVDSDHAGGMRNIGTDLNAVIGNPLPGNDDDLLGTRGFARGGQYRGTALRDARRNKERTYPEPLRDRRCRLVVFGIEVGGRWSDEAFLKLLARTKARQTPALLPPFPHQHPDPPLERHAHALQHPSLTKTNLAATTSKATPLPSVRSLLKSPAPPATPDFQPPPKETGLDLALSFAHPGAAGI